MEDPMSACLPSFAAVSHRLAALDARIHPAVPIAAMVAGFALWWPLGLAVLALWRGAAFAERRGRTWRRWPAAGATGNTAFDAHRAAVLQRLEAERRALDDQQRDFGAFLDQLKRARDREEFDRFMQGRGPAAG
jgi:hypothetical protein